MRGPGLTGAIWKLLPAAQRSLTPSRMTAAIWATSISWPQSRRRSSERAPHDISFANVDDRLCLWIDGAWSISGTKRFLLTLRRRLIQRPWDEDLIPVGVAAHGADVTVSHLVVKRDIYYRCDFVVPGVAKR